MQVPIDTVTALETLISRLNANWQFVETGKMYWIGYTDDMYSIAQRREAAIEPLLAFVRTSANDQGKWGQLIACILSASIAELWGGFRRSLPASQPGWRYARYWLTPRSPQP